jgi:DNA-binding helix-hairpin-helix protein with protein kinase domain
MHKQVFDASGNRIAIGKQLGRGGEGAVFDIEGQPNYVAKLYHAALTPQKSRKIITMAKRVSPAIAKIATWPTATLHTTSKNDVVGLVMPKLGRAQEIHELFNPGSRKKKFPKANWHFLVRTARNCASAFATLHEAGIVIGDVNQNNVFVSDAAIVTLVDCDSFQIHDGKQPFRCVVGVPEFTPPELHGQKFTEIDRSANHDSFGLAILIFQLLFMGYHPYQGRFLGQGDMPLAGAVASRRFAYGKNAGLVQMAPAPRSLLLDDFPLELTALFEAAFAQQTELGGRPTAKHWETTLANLEKTIIKCQYDQNHVYTSRRSRCPWCEHTDKFGVELFIAIVIPAEQLLADNTQRIAAMWARITASPRPGQNITRAARMTSFQARSHDIVVSSSEQRTLRILFTILFVTALTATTLGFVHVIIGVVAFLATLVFGVTMAVLWYNRPENACGELISELRVKLRVCEVNLRKQVERAAEAHRGFTHLHSDTIEKAYRRKSEADQIPAQMNAELANSRQSARQVQLDHFLRSHPIHNCGVKGIGPFLIAQLQSYGIETAFDVKYSDIINIPAFKDARASQLVDWREKIVRRFRFDANKQNYSAFDKQVQAKYQRMQMNIGQELAIVENTLQSLAYQSKTTLEALDAEIAKLQNEKLMLTEELRQFGTISWF